MERTKIFTIIILIITISLIISLDLLRIADGDFVEWFGISIKWVILYDATLYLAVGLILLVIIILLRKF